MILKKTICVRTNKGSPSRGSGKDSPMIPQNTDDRETAGMAALVTQGVVPPDLAQGLTAALQALDSGAEMWNVTRLKQNPGQMLSFAGAGAPQVLTDGKRRGAEPVVAIAAGDLRGLVAALVSAAAPRFATGREIFGNLARAGVAMDITLAGLPDRPEPPMSIEAALSARPVAG